MKITYLPDNVWAKVESPGGQAWAAQIEQLTSFRPKGYTFAPKYKKGQWDGFIRLARKRKDGVYIPAGLVPHVVEGLGGPAYIEVADQRHFEPGAAVTVGGQTSGYAPECEVPLSTMQEQAVQAALRAKTGILQAPTGTGKGRIIGEIIRRLQLPALVLVDKKDLLDQLGREIESVIRVPVGAVGNGLWNPYRCTVATVQTLAARLNTDPSSALALTKQDQAQRFLEGFGVVIVDEAHHAEAETYSEVLQRMTGAAYRFGLSATAFRSYKGKQDNLGTYLKVQAFLGPPIYNATVEEAVDSGRIVAPEIYVVHGCVYPGVALNYREEYDLGIVDNVSRNVMIAGLAKRMPGQTVVLVERVEHGELLQDLIGCSFIHGGYSAQERQKVYESFKRGDISTLILSKLADEALDLPNIDTLILAGGGRAPHRQIQRIGRAMRATEDKVSVTVFDFVDYGKYIDKHYRRRRRTYDSEPAYAVLDIDEEDMWQILRTKE